MLHTKTEDGYQINIPYSFCGYTFLKIIGHGSSSIVGLIEEDSTNLHFAAKIIPKTYIEEKDLSDQIQKEISVLHNADHPNIVKIYRTFQLKNRYNEFYFILILEYCENGDLLSYMTKHRIKNNFEYHKIINGFLEAVKYLHKRGISHGDIKLENILIDSNLNAKISDFCYCKTTIIAEDEAKYGTLIYAAPELFENGMFNALKADIWAIGITLYCLSERIFPYKNGEFQDVVEQIKSGCLHISPSISNNLRFVVERCTELNPENRPNIDELMSFDYFSSFEKINE